VAHIGFRVPDTPRRARLVGAMRGQAPQGSARQCPARHGRRVDGRTGSSTLPAPTQGVARNGLAWHGSASRGRSWLGEAPQGKARRSRRAYGMHRGSSPRRPRRASRGGSWPGLSWRGGSRHGAQQKGRVGGTLRDPSSRHPRKVWRRESRLGKARCGAAVRGTARQRQGKGDWQPLRFEAWAPTLGVATAWQGSARRGVVRRGTTRHGKAWGATTYGTSGTLQGSSPWRLREATLGLSRRGLARRRVAWTGTARRGAARRGDAPHGKG
jgi:hypothetical protein